MYQRLAHVTKPQYKDAKKSSYRKIRGLAKDYFFIWNLLL